MYTPDYTSRFQRLIDALPPCRRMPDGQIDWAHWTGELVSLMQYAGASTKDIFDTFLFEARVVVESNAVSLEEAKEGIEDFSYHCASLVGQKSSYGETRVN